ncbi:MAG: nucleotidyl transferase AbiEii/AbiGii toxin family protein [Syntrophaceae bacterium]|nr:nucleotidyl transferase AbiEii/AbiGii toxin family protein [Syntrophaceae bacterium]
MLDRVLSSRLAWYAPSNAIEQENALQEILQHYVLAGLSRAGMFRDAVFQGGTCLRIFHGMNRFSEDLDFLLKQPDPAFRWRQYLDSVQEDCTRDGIQFEVQDKSRAGTAVQKAFLKSDSIGKILIMSLPFERRPSQKISIKLEIDTNPPAGSTFVTRFLTFPVTLPVTVQKLESGFALKLHALLCRPYVKGRDWYDFLWYSARNIRLDFPLLQNALQQHGPWAGQKDRVTLSWLYDQLTNVITHIDWAMARNDVQRFLPMMEQEGLRVWGRELFMQQLGRVCSER